MLVVIVLIVVIMGAIALGAIVKGKDGIVTGAVCAAMTTIITTILVGGLHRHRDSLRSSVTGNEGGDLNANRPEQKD